MKSRSKYIGLGCLGGGLLAALILSVFLGYLFWQYRGIPEKRTQDQFPISVAILDPGSGHKADKGVPVMVSVLASGLEPLLSVELWANDLLVGVQGAPSSAGVPSLPGYLVWIPSKAGLYSLRARANSTNGQTAISDVIWIFILADSASGEETDVFAPAPSGGGAGDPPSDEAIAQMPPPADYSQPAPPPAAEPLEPAELWKPDLSGFLTWLSAPSLALEVPGLFASVEGCKVKLTIHDLSDNELGFNLYRTQFGETQNIDPTYTLASQPGQGWLSFEDDLPHGSTYTYIVEAFNAWGASGPSNPVVVDALASGCPPPAAPPMNALELVSLKTAFPAEQAYCYISRNALHWFRFPAVGFLPGGQAGNFELQGQVSDLFIEVAGEEEQQSVTPTSYWDCWGWAGGELSQLGVFQVDLGLTLDGPKTIKDDINLAELVFTYGSLTPQGGEIGLEALLGSDIQNLIAALDPTATDAQLLAPTLHYSTDPSNCIANLLADLDSDYCHKFDDISKYIIVDKHIHPYLYWDLNDKANCADPGNCTNMDELTYFPYSVSDWGYNLYDLQVSESVPINTYRGFDEHLYVVPPAWEGCGALRTYEVRTFVELDQTFTYESSSPYAVLTFTQPCSLEDNVTVDVEFTMLEFNNVDDGWFDEDIEVYGWFSVVPSLASNSATLYYGLSRNMGGWGNAASVEGCASGLEGIEAYGPFSKADWECPISYGNETTTTLGMTSGDDPYAGYSPSHSTFHIPVREGDNQILVSVALFDYDYQSGNDPVCIGSVWMTKEPTQRWMEAINFRKWHLYQGDNGNASCNVWWDTTVHEQY